MSTELKLTAELVPTTAWGNNLRSQISRREWNEIRLNVHARQGRKCGICAAEGRFICHEIWEYDDINHVQRLAGFIAICDLCNHVKHLGHASILAAQGKLDMKKVEEHFMRVNECDLETFKIHAREAMIKHRERSQYKWHLDLGEYEQQARGDNKAGEENNIEEGTITQELNELGELHTQRDALEVERQAQIDQVLTPEIKARIEEIETDFDNRLESVRENISSLGNKVRRHVEQYGSTVKGASWQAVWCKGQASWDKNL